MESTSEAASRYWDANREKSKDPAFWMAHPLCRQAINRRVSGSPHEWPLDWFKRVHAENGFDRGVSWGSGLGAFERAAVRIGLVKRIEAFDVSPASLEDARKLAAQEELQGIYYALGDFNNPTIPAEQYDIAFFHASLHHVSALERLFRRLAFSLKPGGAVYVDEYVGPSRDQWTREKLQLAQAVLDMAPEAGKLKPQLDLPIEIDDPSEAVRSSEIQHFLEAFFDLSVWRPYGGQVVDLVMPCLSKSWTDSDEGHKFVAAMLEIEEYELARDPGLTHHVVAYGHLKSFVKLFSPLSRQAYAALVRRARVYLEG